ncbi:MAG: hypothetical protein ACQGVK_20565 [Myxococcota bacterium]
MPSIRARARRLFRVALVSLAILSVIPLTACNFSTIRLLVTDFDSGAVAGLHFWKLDYAKGTYEEALDLEFIEVVEQGGGETLVYELWKNGRVIVTSMAVPVERIQGLSDAAVIRPLLAGLAPGAYRLSSYNEAGDSALSEGWLTY